MSSLASLRRRKAAIALTAGVLFLACALGTAHAADAVPCDARPRLAAGDSGWRVQVDPKTGVYSLPAPGALPAPDAAGVRARDVVIRPGTTAAGGWVIRLDGATAEQQ